MRFGATHTLTDSAATPEGTPHQARLQNLLLGTRYYFRVFATDPSGNVTATALDSFVTLTGAVDVADRVPDHLDLSAGAPNPTSGGTRFRLALPRPARVEFRIHDVLGREVWSRPAGAMPAGRHEIEWPGTDASGKRVAPGLYLARMRVEDRRWLRRIAVIR